MELPGVFNLAENLENYTVNGWQIKSKIPNKPSTGGNFSVGSIVENEVGIKGFLKALDYSKAMFSPTAARDLQAMTTAYNFEHQFQVGELIVNQGIAEEVLEIFWELFQAEYAI